MDLWLVLVAGAILTAIGLWMIIVPLIQEMNVPKPVEVDPDDVAVKLLGADAAVEYRRQSRRAQAIRRARARRVSGASQTWADR